MDVWEWVTTTTSPDSLFTTFGLGVLAILFATDRILTRGQHERRVADLTTHHAREHAEKDARLATVDESRREWKAAEAAQRDRASKATDSVAEMASALSGIQYVLESLNQAVGEKQ